MISNEKAIGIAAPRLDIHTLTEDDLQVMIQTPGLTPVLHTVYRKE